MRLEFEAEVFQWRGPAPYYFAPQSALQLGYICQQAGQKAPESKPTLEINPEHALVKRLDNSAHFDDLAQVLFDQAVLAEGGHLEDPAAYVKRVNALLVG